MSVAFTSSAASNQIASRTVRAMDSSSVQATTIVNDLLTPIAQQLSQSGKLRRGALKSLCVNLVKRLKLESAVMHVVAETLNSPISTKEDYDVRFILGINRHDGEWIEFHCAEIFLTRKSVSVTMKSTDIRVHRHALSRFMQREQKPLTAFFAQVMEPLHLCHILAPMTSETGKIAVSIGPGLLLGNIIELDDPISAVHMTYDPRMPTPPVEQVVEDDLRHFVIKLMTYVDVDSMLEFKTGLHQRLSTFYHTHKAACSIIFDAENFDMKLMPAKDLPEVTQSCNAAFADAQTLAQKNNID